MPSNSSVLRAPNVPRSRRQKQLDRKRKRTDGSQSSHPAKAPRTLNSHEGQIRQRKSASAGIQSVKDENDSYKISDTLIGGQVDTSSNQFDILQDQSSLASNHFNLSNSISGCNEPTFTSKDYYDGLSSVLSGAVNLTPPPELEGKQALGTHRFPCNTSVEPLTAQPHSIDQIGVKEARQDAKFRQHEGKVTPTPTQYRVPSPLLYHRRSSEILTRSTETCQCYNSNGNCVFLRREERAPHTSKHEQEVDTDWQQDSYRNIMDPFESISDKSHSHRQKQPSFPEVTLFRTREIFVFPNSTSCVQAQPSLDSQFNVAAATRVICGPLSSVKALEFGGEISQQTTDRYSLTSGKSPIIACIAISRNPFQMDHKVAIDSTPGSKVPESPEGLSIHPIVSRPIENACSETGSETVCQQLTRSNNHVSNTAHFLESSRLSLAIETPEKTPNPDIGIIKKPCEEIWDDYHSCSVVEKLESRLDSESNIDHDEMFVSAEEWVDEGWASDNSSLQSFEVTEPRLEPVETK